MPARNLMGRSQWDMKLTGEDEEDDPIYVTFDRTRTQSGLKIKTTYSPTDPNTVTTQQEWRWQNGANGGGAGTTIETDASRESGASEYGEFVWLRRRGVAQPAGALVEYGLPTVTRTLTSGGFGGGTKFSGDLWLTTLGRTAVCVPNCSETAIVTEQDFGVGAISVDTAAFARAGTTALYVSELLYGMQKFDGTTWAAPGGASTRRGYLDVVYWVVGAAMSTGGIGDAGNGAYSMTGTDLFGVGMYHVQDDPMDPADWSAVTYVGPGTDQPIVSSASSNRVVWYGTGQGVYGVNDQGYAPNLTKWMEATASISNCTALCFWDNYIFGAHEQGLFLFNPDGSRVDTGTFLNFGAKTGTMPIFGRPLVLSPGPDGLYVGYYNADSLVSYVGYLCKDPDGSYRWSMAEAVIPNEIVTFVEQMTDNNGNPGLFIGTRDAVSGELSLYRQSQPKWGDPETDAIHNGPFRAATDWNLRLSRWNGSKGVQHVIRRLAVEQKYVGSEWPDNTVDVLLSNDDEDFVLQGTSTEGTRWTGTPVSGSIRATNTQVRLDVHNTTTSPVVISSVSVYYTARPERTAFRTYPVIIAEGMTPHKDPKVTLARLERVQNEGPQNVVDKFFGEYEGLVEDFSIISAEEDAKKSVTIRGDLTISTTRRVTRYDRGDARDAGLPYS